MGARNVVQKESGQGKDLTQNLLADRLAHIQSSPTLALAAKAKALAKEGHAVIDFTAGQPDMPTPSHVKSAGISAIEANQTRYTPAAGIPELRAAFAETSNSLRGTSYKPDETIISCGGKHALFNIFQVLCQPGDSVVIMSPYWVSFPPMVHLSGATPIIVETIEEDGFVPNIESIKKAIQPNTKAIIVNSPSNPTGAVIDADTLKAIADIAKENKLWVISDEIYDRFVYPPNEHVSILQTNPEIVGQTLLVQAVSKTYSMTGWRIGAVCGPKPVIAAMTKIQSHSTSNPTSISQYAALEALKGDQATVGQMINAFKERRDIFVKGINEIPGFKCRTPLGAFYAWCSVSGLGKSSAELADEWLNKLYVATVPGEGFGAPGYIRFSFATTAELINEGISRIKKWYSENR